MSADHFVATLQRWVEVSTRRSMRDFLRYARESRLSMSNLGAIFYAHRCVGCAVSDVAEHLGVSNSAASMLLDRLVDQGYLARLEDPQDRRVKRIHLTERGERVFEEGIQARGGWMSDLAAELSEDEKRMVTQALDLMIPKMVRLDPEVEHDG